MGTVSCFGALLLWIGTAVCSQVKPEATLAVVVHVDNPVVGLELRELEDVLRLERKFWSSGLPVVLLQRPYTSEVQQELLRSIYRMSEAELRRYWARRLFAGEISAVPTVVRKADAATQAVAKSTGAITVVLASEVGPGQKVLRINGKLPGEAGYPLVIGR